MWMFSEWIGLDWMVRLGCRVGARVRRGILRSIQNRSTWYDRTATPTIFYSYEDIENPVRLD